MYVSAPPHPDGEPQPSRVLRGFATVKDLKAGETRKVEVKLDKYALSGWEEDAQAWVIRTGTYGVAVAASSEDVKLRGEVVVEKQGLWKGL